MSYQDHNNDRLTEELEALDLLAEFKDIYKTEQADRQSLIRIRERLQNLPSTSAIAETPIPLSMSNKAAERGKFRNKTVEPRKRAFPLAQRLNKAIVFLVAASIIGAFTITFTRTYHANPPRNASLPTPVVQEKGQPFPQPFFGPRFSLTNPTTVWLPTSVHLPGGGEVNGPLLRTTDAGKTWHDITPPQLSIGTGPHYSFYVLEDGKTAWIVDRTSAQVNLLYQSHDGGQTWKKLSVPQKTFINTITFVDQKHGWLLGELLSGKRSEVLFATKDGGQSWQQVLLPALQYPRDHTSQLQFIDSQTGWLSILTQSGDQAMFITHTAGSSWIPLPLSEDIKAKVSISFRFVSAKHGYLTAIHYQQKTGQNDLSYFYETNDGGQTWQNQIFEPSMPTNVTDPAYINDRQIQLQHGDTTVVYTRENNRWIQSSTYTLSDGKLFYTTFVSATTGIGIVDYSMHPSNTDPEGDQIGLVKTTDSGKTWTKVSLSIPTRTVTTTTMAYLTNPGWSYDTAYTDTGPKSFTPQGQPSLGNPAPLTTKKWLVRFLCTTSTADLTLDGKHISANGCDKGPISKVISFDTAHSIQTVKVGIQKEASWLVVLEACTNEKLCLANTH